MSMRTIGLTIIFLAVNAAALTSDNFAYRAEIKTPSEATWYRLPLPIAVQFAAQSSDLRDVRIFNADGEALPYSIVRAIPQAQRELQKLDVKLFPLWVPRSTPNVLPTVRVHEGTAGTVIDVVTSAPQNKEEPILRGWLLDTRDIQGRFESLQLSWQDDIEGFQRFSIETSDDLQNWRTVSTGQIGKLAFNNETIVQRDVPLSSAAAKYVRLLWLDPIQAIHLSSAQLISVNTTTQAAPLVWTNVLHPVRSENGDSYFELPAAISIERIRFENLAKNTLAPLQVFGRQKKGVPWNQFGSGIIYRLPAEAGEVHNNEINLSGVVLSELKLHIDQRGTGIPEPEISVGTTANTLVFLARGKKPYTLAIGNKLSTSAELPLSVLIPSATTVSALNNGGDENNSEIATAELSSELIAQSIATDTAGVVKSDGAKRTALWVVLLLGVALLVGMALQMLRKPSEMEKKN